jgi:hypothetical protein
MVAVRAQLELSSLASAVMASVTKQHGIGGRRGTKLAGTTPRASCTAVRTLSPGTRPFGPGSGAADPGTPETWRSTESEFQFPDGPEPP